MIKPVSKNRFRTLGKAFANNGIDIKYTIPKIKRVSRVQKSKAIKTTPIPNNKKTVALGEIAIFFNDKVGILLTNKNAISIVKYGVNFLISRPKFKFVNS